MKSLSDQEEDRDPLSEDLFAVTMARVSSGKEKSGDFEKIAAQMEYDKKQFPFFSCVLSQRQREVLENFERGILRVVVAGGNRSGKTILEAFWAICMASDYWPTSWEPVVLDTGEKAWRPILEEVDWIYTPAAVWVSSLSRDVQITARGIQDAILAMIPYEWIEDIHWWNRKYVLSITLKNGSEIQFKTSEAGADKYQSATLNALALDELHPSDIWEEATSRVGGNPLRIFYAYFPRNGMDWTYKKFFRVGADPGPATVVDNMSFLDNPFIPASVKETQVAEWKKTDMGDSRIYGKYVELTGLVYDKFVRKFNLYTPQTHPWFVKTGAPPEHWPQWMAIDSHNSAKGLACLFAALAPNRRRFYWQEYLSRGSPDDWVRDLKNILRSLNMIECFIDPSARATDARGFCIARHIEEGLSIPIRDANRARGLGILAVQRGFGTLLDSSGSPVDGGPGIVVSVDCPMTVNQIEMYSRKSSTLGDVVKEDDEFVDCMRYIEIEDIAGDPEGDGKDERGDNETNDEGGHDFVGSYKKRVTRDREAARETSNTSYGRTI